MKLCIATSQLDLDPMKYISPLDVLFNGKSHDYVVFSEMKR